jgi:hypothetical protein
MTETPEPDMTSPASGRPHGTDGPRYLVAGKDLKTGVPGSDSSNSDEYFELGWEVTTTYLQLVHGRRHGTFTDSDVVVTASGREFLYRSSFSTVISYTEFRQLGVEAGRVLDLVKRTSELYSGDTWLRKLRLRALYLRWFHFWRYRIRYRHFKNGLPMETASIGPFPVAEEFLCICIRFRDHQPQRNLPKAYLGSLLDAVSDRRCYLVGYGAEDLIRHSRHSVCSLAEFAALVQSRNCAAVIGTMTGPIQLAQMIHPNRLFVFDLDDHYRQWGRMVPSILSDLCNFPRGRHALYTYRPTVDQLLRDLSAPGPESRITAQSYQQSPRFFDAEHQKGHAFFEHDPADRPTAVRP